MKRFHVHVAVASLEESVSFYSALFGQEPSVSKSDYAKWMLDDPKINFAISHRPGRVGPSGLDHLGFQLETEAQLSAMTAKLQAAGLAVTHQGATTCCYAKSDKGWVQDPQGISWESFVTLGESTSYGAAGDLLPPAAIGADGANGATGATGACCAPTNSAQKLMPIDMPARPAQDALAGKCGPRDSGARSCC